MRTLHCRLNIRPLHQGRYLVTSVLIQAPDEAEALRRAGPWLAACVIGRYRDR